MKKVLLYFLISVLLVSCAYSPYHRTNKIYKKKAKGFAAVIEKAPLPLVDLQGTTQAPYFAGTVNFNLRKPNFVIIHHTAQNSCEQTLNTFTRTKTEVSAHYVICREGTIYHMLNDYLRAWHAGAGSWGKNTDINSASIGIELDNNGSEPFSDLQIQSLLLLLQDLKQKYNIPTHNFIGHADIAPRRKQDPNIYFPWKKLADSGFGIWYDEYLADAPENFDYTAGLRLIGYDTSDLNAAIIAFKLHFIQSDINPFLTPRDKSIIYQLSRK